MISSHQLQELRQRTMACLDELRSLHDTFGPDDPIVPSVRRSLEGMVAKIDRSELAEAQQAPVVVKALDTWTRFDWPPEGDEMRRLLVRLQDYWFSQFFTEDVREHHDRLLRTFAQADQQVKRTGSSVTVSDPRDAGDEAARLKA